METAANLVPLVLIAVVFWLFIVRPARRRQREFVEVQNSVEVGTEIITAGGIYGRVSAVDDDTVHLDIADGVTIKMVRQAIGRVLDDESTATETSDDDAAA